MSTGVEFTFTWIIENIFMAKFSKPVRSPEFYVPWCRTRWILTIEETSETVTVQLRRLVGNEFSATLNLNISLVVTGKDGISSTQTISVPLTGNEVFHFRECSHILSGVNDYMLDDILALRCEISTKEIASSLSDYFRPTTPIPVASSSELALCKEVYFLSSGVEDSLRECYPIQCTARTRITVFSRSVSCTFEEFSGRQDDAPPSLIVPLEGECTLLLSFSFGSERDIPRLLEVDIIRNMPHYGKWTFVKCKVSLVGSREEILPISSECMFEDEDMVWHFAFANYQTLVRNAATYLRDGNLTVHFEFTYSCEGEKYDISDSGSLTKNTGEVCQNFKENLSKLYLNEIYSDVKLRTEDWTLAAHKSILCARSSVFRAMFETDMQEKTTNMANIPDVDTETLDKLLHFMYSCTLDRIGFDDAVKLYKAADKYDVLCLKDRCSIVLQSFATVSDFGELLVLSQVYSDARLKKTLKNLMMLAPEDTFRSSHWISFMESNRTQALEMAYDVFMSKLDAM